MPKEAGRRWWNRGGGSEQAPEVAAFRGARRRRERDVERELGMAARMGAKIRHANMEFVSPLTDEVMASAQAAYGRWADAHPEEGLEPHDVVMWALNVAAGIVSVATNAVEVEERLELWLSASSTWQSICLQEMQRLGVRISVEHAESQP